MFIKLLDFLDIQQLVNQHGKHYYVQGWTMETPQESVLAKAAELKRKHNENMSNVGKKKQLISNLSESRALLKIINEPLAFRTRSKQIQ